MRKGIQHSEESKLKMSKSSKGSITWNKGKKLSEEHKKKLSESLRGVLLGTKVELEFTQKKHYKKCLNHTKKLPILDVLKKAINIQKDLKRRCVILGLKKE